MLAAQLMGGDKTRLTSLDLFYSLFITIMQPSNILTETLPPNFSYEGILNLHYDQNKIIYFYFVL